MRLLWIFLCVLLLVGCSPDLIGTWKDEEGLTELTFEDDHVRFIDVEGTYKIKGNHVILTFDQRELDFEYDLDDDDLTLFINDSKITLHRQ